MDSACSSRKTSPPVDSQPCSDVQTETCGEAWSSLGHIIPVDHQDHVKKEERKDEDYLCGEASGSVGHVPLTDQQKHVIKEETEDEDYLCKTTEFLRCSPSHTGGGTSSSVGHVTYVHNRNGEVFKEEINEEEFKDEEFLCTTTVCENRRNNPLLSVWGEFY